MSANSQRKAGAESAGTENDGQCSRTRKTTGTVKSYWL